MNCTDFTSGHGNRNAKRNCGAANCGALRAKHHQNSLTDLVGLFGLLVPQTWLDESGGGNEITPFICEFVPIGARKPRWSSQSSTPPAVCSHSPTSTGSIQQQVRSCLLCRRKRERWRW